MKYFGSKRDLFNQLSVDQLLILVNSVVITCFIKRLPLYIFNGKMEHILTNYGT